MDINAFKKALKAGDVAFSYKKKDGTIREALGTLCESMIPKTAPVAKFKCTNIDWDIDANETMLTNLPSTVIVELDDAYVNSLGDGEHEDDAFFEELEEAIADELSDKYGFCVRSFGYNNVEKRAPKKLPEGTIFYYDLGKKGFRSFNESQLIEWKQ